MHWLPTLLLTIAFVDLSLPAQEQWPEPFPRDHVAKLREAGAQALDVRWRVDRRGQLSMFPSPSAAAMEWEPMFGELQGGLGFALANSGIVGMVTLLHYGLE